MIHLLFTGGTISMQHDAARGGNVPTLGGEALLALAPEIAMIAECRIENWARMPACHMQQETLTRLRQRVLELAGDPAVQGIVITHGTDTIEETAYFLARTVEAPLPIVLTGAMRTAGEPDWDGTRNLTDAVRVAASPASRGRGALVVFHGRILPGLGACKRDTMALDTFHAPHLGQAGAVDAAGVRFTAAAAPAALAGLAPAFALTSRTALVPAIVGDDGTLAEAAAARFDGLVIEGFGSGNLPPALAEAAYRCVERGQPVVLSSRCADGVVTPIYGFDGGSATTVRRGLVPAGPRTPAQARLELAIALSAGRPYGA